MGKSTIADLARSERSAEMTSLPTGGNEPDLEEVDEEAIAALDVRQLARIGAKLSARLEQALDKDEYPVLQRLTPLRLQVSATLARVRPPPRVDPEADPANLAARAEVRTRLDALAVELTRSPEARAAVRAHLDAIEVAEPRPDG